MAILRVIGCCIDPSGRAIQVHALYPARGCESSLGNRCRQQSKTVRNLTDDPCGQICDEPDLRLLAAKVSRDDLHKTEMRHRKETAIALTSCDTAPLPQPAWTFAYESASGFWRWAFEPSAISWTAFSIGMV